MNLKFIQVTLAACLLSFTTACSEEIQQSTNKANNLQSENQPVITDDKSTQDRPETKTGTIYVEGEKTDINLKLYKAQNLFTTYFPDADFLAESETSEQQQSMKFIANFGGVKNAGAYLQIAFPNDVKTLEEVKNLIEGKNGLIADNKWQIVKNQINNKTYSWAKEKIGFSQNPDIVGDIYIGEEKGKVFYVITHYPVEYGDGFEPRADLILKNLQIGG
jgi:hypothetical protein